jgi:protocatechuate 3,4-dioxygenase beta subunit
MRCITGLATACALLGSQTAATAQAPDSDSFATEVRLTAPGEPGRPLRFHGVVLDYAGKPLAEAAVVVHHADAAGLYNPPGAPTRVPRIRGVAITDAQGRFGFATIWPGAYPDGSQPAHIHLEVAAPAHARRDLEVWFEGDPKITPALRRESSRSPTLAIVRPQARSDGTWAFDLDIRLNGN